MSKCSGLVVVAAWLLLGAIVPHGVLAQDRTGDVERFGLAPDASVVVVGNSFAERMAMSGYLEALIHAAHPDHRITVRQVPWSADEAGFQPRELNVPHTEAYLTEHEADVIIACFGMSESFAGEPGLGRFEADLRERLAAWGENAYNGEAPPRIVLVSPIGHEDLGAPWPTGEAVRRHNADLRAYAGAMRRVAEETGARFVDLLAPEASAPPGPLTTDGILPSETGCWHYGAEIGRQLGWLGGPIFGEPDPVAIDRLRARAWDKHYHFRQIYRPTNTEYVWGRRAEPFGVVNFPPEHEQLRRMVDARQRDLWEMPKPSPEALFAAAPAGPPVWETIPSSTSFPEDDWSPPPVVAEGTETSLGDTDILPPDEFLASFSLADGYTIECFASEQDFPELANPLAMAFDDRHRLWVLCSPTYPHPLPGEMVRDQLIILTDDDKDGKADRCDVFAENFGIATGFAIATDGVYIALAPDLLFFRDVDGDGKADRREVVFSGFGMPDSHHQISAVEWAPDGGFVMHEGTFTRTGIETPFGTRRGRDAAIWHYDPRSRRLELLSHCGFPNPWGHAFDDYGASLMDSTSGGEHFDMSHISTASTFPHKPGKPGPIVRRGRPTAGNEILGSRHFPPDAQGSHLTTQSIGFHGLRWDRLEHVGSSWFASPMPQELLQSSDTNFRPVVVEAGPDGALYVLDWCNPIIGHMQYSVRDPRRDHRHGRVWRVRHESRPLLEPPAIAEAGVDELLELLQLPETNTRALARRRLQQADPSAVLPALRAWTRSLDPADPDHDRLQLESLWVSHGLGRADRDQLGRVLSLDTAPARAAGVRMARRWLRVGELGAGETVPILAAAAEDPDMRVRLEAVVAAGYLGTQEAVDIIQSAMALETDRAMRIVIAETLYHLQGLPGIDSALARRARLFTIEQGAFNNAEWDEDKAFVALRRPDVTDEDRLRALQEAAGDDPLARLATLTEALLDAWEPEALAGSIAPLVVEAARSAPGAPDPDRRLREHPGRPVRALAAAWDLERGTPLDGLLSADAETAVLALTMRGDTPLGAADETALQNAAAAGAVPAAPAVAALAAGRSDAAALTAWLAAQIERGAALRLDTWTHEHELALASLEALHRSPVEAWPESLRPLHLARDEETLERGRDIYLNEQVGCVRCHGPEGEGLPGFPPLAKSPWVHGDPRRAAAIVIHGLRGPIELPGAGTFNSAMAPLGALLNDEQIADVLTYVRSRWGNFAPPVTSEHVAQARGPVGGGQLMPDAATILAAYPLQSDPLLGASGQAEAQGSTPGPNARSSPGLRIPARLVASLVVGAVLTCVFLGIFIYAARRHS